MCYLRLSVAGYGAAQKPKQEPQPEATPDIAVINSMMVSQPASWVEILKQRYSSCKLRH